jgi:hypothetical protein
MVRMTCVALPYQVKADGLDQPIVGNPRYDTVSLQVVDDRTVVKTAKKAGKIVAVTTVVVSGDGNTMTESQTISGILPRPVEMASRLQRAAAGPPRSHPMSGEWLLVEADLTNHEEDTPYQVTGNMLAMSDRAGALLPQISMVPTPPILETRISRASQSSCWMAPPAGPWTRTTGRCM